MGPRGGPKREGVRGGTACSSWQALILVPRRELAEQVLPSTSYVARRGGYVIRSARWGPRDGMGRSRESAESERRGERESEEEGRY